VCFSKLNAPEHFSVNEKLMPTVRKFLNETKEKGKSMVSSTDHDIYGLTYEQKVLFIDNLSRVVGKPKERTDTGSFYPWIVSLVFATDYQKGEAYRLTIEDQSDVL
jgi:hypothetical protein